MKPIGTKDNYVVREMKRTGKTGRQILEELAERNGYKLTLMAMEADVTYPWIIRLCKRYGYDKPPAKAFTYRGKTMSMAQHCRDYGLTLANVNAIYHRHKEQGRDKVWALDYSLGIGCGNANRD